MKIKEIIRDIEVLSSYGNMDKDISYITDDSRKIIKNSMFVALKGFETDGHLYIKDAIELGAISILYQDEGEIIKYKNLKNSKKDISFIRVEDTRRAYPYIMATYYNYPSSQLDLIGVTGTNGKTSTTYLIKAMFDYSNIKNGLIGTISNYVGKTAIAAERTTPQANDLQKLLSIMVADNAKVCIMEVSSHALVLDRVRGCKFKVAVFTNISQDHLDFHKNMEDYIEAKSILFNMAENVVINIDDKTYKKLIKDKTYKEIVKYSIKDREADVFADKISHSIDKTNYELHYFGKQANITLKTPGDFSVYNSLAAISTGILMGLPMDNIIKSLECESSIKGRFENIRSPLGYSAIVDYAHTPDGLKNVILAINKIKEKRLITVFGCGGDRDRTKRPIMGEIAGKLSDLVIITSDNPRTEIPSNIIDEIEQGLINTGVEYMKIEDRKIAIITALEEAKKGDIVLVAGKGHEDYQIIGKEKYPFDDAKIIRKHMSLQV